MGNILVIDDDSSIRSILSKILVGYGHQVTEATDGEIGIEILEQNLNFKVVITDIRMPNKSGNDVARHIKNNSDIDKTPKRSPAQAPPAPKWALPERWRTTSSRPARTPISVRAPWSKLRAGMSPCRRRILRAALRPRFLRARVRRARKWGWAARLPSTSRRT